MKCATGALRRLRQFVALGWAAKIQWTRWDHFRLSGKPRARSTSSTAAKTQGRRVHFAAPVAAATAPVPPPPAATTGPTSPAPALGTRYTSEEIGHILARWFPGAGVSGSVRPFFVLVRRRKHAELLPGPTCAARPPPEKRRHTAREGGDQRQSSSAERAPARPQQRIADAPRPETAERRAPPPAHPSSAPRPRPHPSSTARPRRRPRPPSPRGPDPRPPPWPRRPPPLHSRRSAAGPAAPRSPTR